MTLHATSTAAPGGGWQMVSVGGALYGASVDEGGNLWIAGGTQGVFVVRAGQTQPQLFTLADGLHPYGYPTTGSITQINLKAISIAGGAAGNAYVGYDGIPGCEDEWDQDAPNPDPNIYKSGDADHIWLQGQGVGVAHYDIYTGPGVVTQDPMGADYNGREKICSIYRVVYDGVHDNVWVGANHGYAWLNPDYTGTPFYDGSDTRQVLQEHAHPAINGYTTEDAPVTDDWLLTGGYDGLALEPNGDVWVGGIFRTYRCAGGTQGANFWGCEHDDQPQFGNQVDVWPDPVPSDARPSQRVDDYVTGIAVMRDGSIWVSARNRADNPAIAQAMGVGLAHLSPQGVPLGYLTEAMPSDSLTALAADPLDDSVWIGSSAGLARYHPDTGIVEKFGGDALGAHSGDAVSDIQIDKTTTPRRVVVTFQGGAVGLYSGN